MNFQPVALWLQNHGIGLILRKADPLVGVILQNFHILGLVALLAAVILVDLRLFGLGLVSRPAPQLVRALRPLFWGGAALVAGSGLLMFASDAVRYSGNEALQVKLGLLAAALLYQLLVIGRAERLRPRSAPAGAAAAASLVLWFSVGLAGRAIGFL